MSLSKGSPGSVRFWIPSSPAINMAEKARDGLQDGSGDRLATLPDALVRVHAGAVVPEDRLGHEGDGLAVSQRDVLEDVLVPGHLVRALEQALEADVDLRLTRGRHLVVLLLHLDAHLLQHQHHLAADVLQGVGGGDGEVALLVAWLVAQVGPGAGLLAVEGLLDGVAGLPLTLARLDLVEAVVGTAIVGDAVEDEELRLRPEIGDVADAGRLEVLLRFLRDETGVARILLLRNRIDDVADERQRRVLHEGVHHGGVGVGHDQHVAGVDRHPASDGRPVETETLFEHGLGQFGDRDAEVLPESHEIHELQVDHHGLFVLGKPQDVLRLRHRLFSYGLTNPYSAGSPRSPVRMRTTSSTLLTKILPSPMRPVLADRSIASKAFGTISSERTTSIFTFGRKSTTYSAPRYNSVCPF